MVINSRRCQIPDAWSILTGVEVYTDRVRKGCNVRMSAEAAAGVDSDQKLERWEWDLTREGERREEKSEWWIRGLLYSCILVQCAVALLHCRNSCN